MFIFLMLINLFVNIYSAESTQILQSNVVIIDYNNGQSINSFIPKDTAVINFFGATPRYSAFCRYKKLLQENFGYLISEFLEMRSNYPNGQKLKNIEKRLTKFMLLLEKSKIDLDQLKEEFNLQLFFSAGFDFKEMQYNFNSLLTSAMRTNLQDCKSKYLIHFLLPSYFEDLDKETNINVIYDFLQKAAIFYQQIYQKFNLENNLKICIVIPKMTYFYSVISTKLRKSFEINMDIVKEMICQLGLQNRYVIINQNFDELKLIVQYLKEKQFPDINAVHLLITNARGMPSTIFNSYLIKADKKYDFQTSPLLNDKLLTCILEKFDLKRENYE